MTFTVTRTFPPPKGDNAIDKGDDNRDDINGQIDMNDNENISTCKNQNLFHYFDTD